MAFGLRGAGGTFQSATANQSSMAFVTATTNGSIGDLAVLRIALDNNQTTDGDEVAVTSITSTGNTWTKAKAFTNGQGTAQTGATVEIWYCNLVAAINTGSTITINLSNNTSRDATAAALEFFTMAAGSIAAIEGTPGTLAADAAAAGSLDVTTSNIECLRVRAIASESSTITALTKTAAFTAVLGQNGTTGGTSTNNMWVRGEYAITTGTSLASNPTGGAGTVDHASVYVAFKELVKQTLTPGIVTDTDSFFAPTVAPGSVSLTFGSVFDDTDSFFAPTVAPGSVSLTFGSTYADADSFFAPANLGHQLPVAALYADADSFAVPTVAIGDATLTASLVADADTFHAPTVAPGAVTLTAGLVTDADSFHSPTASASVTLTAGLVTDAEAFDAPTVAPGSVTATASLYSDAETFFVPTAAPGAVTLIAGLVTDADAYSAPTVAPGSVTLVVSLATDADSFHAPTVAPGAASLVAGLATDADTFGAPTVVPGSVTATAALYTDADAFYSPTGALDGALFAGLHDDADAVYAPSQLCTNYDPEPDLIVDADAFYTPALSSPQALAPALYADADSFYSPSQLSTKTLHTTSLPESGLVIYNAGVGRSLPPGLVVDFDGFPNPLFAGPGHGPTVTAGAITLLPIMHVSDDSIYAPVSGSGASQLLVDEDSFPSPHVVGLRNVRSHVGLSGSSGRTRSMRGSIDG